MTRWAVFSSLVVTLKTAVKDAEEPSLTNPCPKGGVHSLDGTHRWVYLVENTALR